MPKMATTGTAARAKGTKQPTKARKVASPSSSTARTQQHVPERKSPGTKAALVRAVTVDLQDLTVGELRSFKRLVETKVKGKSGSVVTVYLPDAAMGNTVVEFKLVDGSTWIGQRAAAQSSGRFVVIEAKRRRARVPTPSKPGAKASRESNHAALDHARRDYKSVRDSVVSQSLSMTHAARRMNLTTEGLSARVDRGQMLAFAEHNRKMVPVELIDDDQPDHTVPGLSDVIRAAEMDPFRLAVWLLNPVRSLGETRPIDELRAGKVDRVIRAVRGVEAS